MGKRWQGGQNDEKKKDFFQWGRKMSLDCEDIMTVGTKNPLDGRQSGKSECKYLVLGQ